MAGLNFAVIGCGAIAESYFLPVLTSRHDLCADLWLVDPNEERLALMARQFKISNTATALDQVLHQIDAAVIATPHNTHFALSNSLAAAGKHIFCEKPMTTTVQQAADMTTAAAAAGVVLMVNNLRRNHPSFRAIKNIIDRGELGALRAASWIEGYKFNWPTKSGFYFTQQRQNNLPPPGIMLDIGSHVIDLLCWWLGDAPTVLTCQTDSLGGPEVRASLALDFAGVIATIELSYYHKMKNRYCLQFENGCITGGTSDEHQFTLTKGGAKPKCVTLIPRRMSYTDAGGQMLSNFVSAIAGKNQPLVTGQDVQASIRVITEGYQRAEPYDAPWLPRFA